MRNWPAGMGERGERSPLCNVTLRAQAGFLLVRPHLLGTDIQVECNTVRID